MGRGLYRTARGELKNIIAFGRHRETHRPSPRRPGTRQHHQSQGGQRQKPGPFPRRPHRHRPQLRLHRGHRPRRLNPYPREPLPVGAARAPSSPPPSSATTARATPRTWRRTTPVSPDATSKPSSIPPPSSTTTTPPPARSTASRREGEDRPRLASLVIIGRTTATANRATCATTAAPRAWTIITARETTVETVPTPATTRCPPPLVARLQLRRRSAASA